MAKISEERLKRYRDLANIPSMEIIDSEIRAIYQRMEAEGAPVKNMRDSKTGMFLAPFKQKLDELDIACVGIPMENSIPLRTSTRMGPEAIRQWSQWFGPVHEIWKTIPFDTFSVGDFGDIKFNDKDI
ncbi:MAG: hypothetical protein ACJAXH_003025, partial [Colwellia sp.]